MFYESDGLYNDEREYAEKYILGSTMSGRIEESNDVDCYKVYLRPGHLKYTFTVPSGMNYRFKVYREGSSDTDTFICEDDNPCTQTRSGEKDISISEADTYYICISFHVENRLFDTQRFYNFRLYYTELTVLNFNQKYNGYEDVVNSSGCALCCAADLTSFYKGSTVTVNELKSPNYSIKDNQSIYYEGSSICNFDVAKYFILTKNSSTSNLFSIVKSEIESGNPVLLHYNSEFSSAGHWVVAYGYTNSCSNNSDIYICDPAFTYDTLWGTTDVYYTGNYFTDNLYNNGITIQQSINDSSISSIREIFTVSER